MYAGGGRRQSECSSVLKQTSTRYVRWRSKAAPERKSITFAEEQNEEYVLEEEGCSTKDLHLF